MDCHLGGGGDDMAALDGKITIGIDYRPCIVHIPAKKQSYRKKGDRINVYEKEIEPEHEIKPYSTVGVTGRKLSENHLCVAVIPAGKYLEHSLS